MSFKTNLTILCFILISFIFTPLKAEYLDRKYTPGFNENFINDITLAKTIDTNLPRKYHVSFQKYFKIFPSKESDKTRERTRESMNFLINRFNIKKKSILSIGPGSADEEFWFGTIGNILTFFEIDESDIIEKYIKKDFNQLKSNSKNDELTIYLGDFTNSETPDIGKFDILYMSGFTPNEVRRHKIMSAYTKINQYPGQKILENIYGKSDPAWPAWEKPFHPSIEKGLKYLKEGGLFIYQMYYSAPDVDANPHYIQLTKMQLLDNGIIPIEFYGFKNGGGYLLIVGLKGTPDDALQYINKISNNPPLLKFHGRSGIDNTARLIYSLANLYSNTEEKPAL